MCLQTSLRIVCIALMVSLLNSCMVILKSAAISGAMCRQAFARGNLSRFGQRTQRRIAFSGAREDFARDMTACLVFVACRQSTTRAFESHFHVGQGPAVKVVCNHGFASPVLTDAAPAKSVGGHGFEPARGKETAPARAEAICGGVVPDARRYNEATLLRPPLPQARPSGLPRSD